MNFSKGLSSVLFLVLVFTFSSLVVGSNVELSDAISAIGSILSNKFWSIDEIGSVTRSVSHINMYLSKSKLETNLSNSIALINHIKFFYEKLLELSLEIFKLPDAQKVPAESLNSLVSNLCDLAPILNDFGFLKKESVFDFVFQCYNLFFRIGTNWNFRKLLFDPVEPYMILIILEHISTFLELDKNEIFYGKEEILVFYFYYAQILSKKGEILNHLTTISGHPLNALLFIHKHQINSSENVCIWLRLYYKNIDIILQKHLQDPTVMGVLFNMIKGIKDIKVEDVDWAIGIFNLSAIKYYIFQNPSFLAIFMDLLSRMSNLFPQKFAFVMKTLNPDLRSELNHTLTDRELKKNQILASIQVSKIIKCARLDPELTPDEGYSNWRLAIEDLKKFNFFLLKQEDFTTNSKAVRQNFIDLSSQYFSSKSSDTNIMLTLNSYIPLLTKLDIFNFEAVEISKLITRDMGIYFFQKYSKLNGAIGLVEIKELLIQFHSEVFTEEERLLQFSMIFTVLKFIPLNFKILWDVLGDLNWQNNEMIILNIQYRIKKLKLIHSDPRDENEINEIKEIIDFFGSEAKVLSRTQILCFKSIFKYS